LTTAGTAGTYTKVTTDSKGRVTSGTSASLDDLSDVVITTPAPDEVIKYNGTSWVNAASPGGGGGTVTSITAGTGLSASPASPITTSGTLNLANTAVSANSYGSASAVGTFTVDAQGRLTAASSTTISIAQSQVTTAVSDKSANYSIVSGDKNTFIRSTGSAITITVDNVLSAGEQIQFIQAGSGVTLSSADSLVKTAKQYAGVSVVCAASGVYYLIGNLGV
jgi:hypothetical protein